MAQEKDYSLKVRLTQLTGAFVKDLTGRTAIGKSYSRWYADKFLQLKLKFTE